MHCPHVTDFRFCNETIHTESESTPHFLIFNAHKSFIDIILYPLLKNFCFKFIFLDLSRSNNENNGKYLLQLIQLYLSSWFVIAEILREVLALKDNGIGYGH